MRDKFTNRKMAVADLRLDSENPRLSGEAKTQVECFNELIDLNTRHFETIFKDIAKFGLTPLPIIIGYNSNKEVVVKDGNRRVAAIMAINNPVLIQSDTLRRRINKFLEGTDNKHQYKEIDCKFCSDDEYIEYYIERLHGGALEGAGQIVWDATQNERHRINKGRKVLYPIGFPVHSWLVKQGLIHKGRQIQISNLQRLLSNPKIRKKLGFITKKGMPHLVGDEKETKKIWDILLEDFTGQGITVSDIKSLEQRQGYVDELFKKHKLNEPTPSGEALALSTSTRPQKTQNDKTQPGQRRQPTWKRKRVIPAGHGIRIPQKQDYNKANNIFNEMLNGIEVQKAPNTAAIMLRTFLEITLVHFCRNKGIMPKSAELKNLIQKANNYCNDNEIFNNDKLVILKKLKEDRLVDSISTFNKFVHSPDYQATAQGVNTFYENYEFFLAYCWDEIGGHS